MESRLTGRHLGAYQVIERLGAGGMGEVYRARDTALQRDVAIKILLGPFTTDPDPSTGSGSSRAKSRDDRLARFEREARILASLNHPHIGAIYGLEHVDGAPALVLELVEGETLSDRVARGPVPLQDALGVARQIASALAAAHDAGIVHRDLKPSNVKITPSGVVKVLDFGLAKGAQDPRPELTQSPTLAGETRAGIIVGTPAYMSPEQARGGAVDARTDIWSFGCLLYEMLTGRAPFARDTVTDTLAAIVDREPDWSRLPTGTPPRVRQLIERCLEKDAGSRLRDAREAARELHEDRASQAASSSIGRWALAAAAATLLVLAVLLTTGWPQRWANVAGGGSIRSLAVLPFENLSGSASQEYFVDGMTEALITELAKLDGVRVISRASVMRYKGGGKSVPEIARELRVDGVVTGGAVSDARSRVAVTAQLVRAESDENIWAERYERDLRDVVTLQSEIARAASRRRLPRSVERKSSTRVPSSPTPTSARSGRCSWRGATRRASRRAGRRSGWTPRTRMRTRRSGWPTSSSETSSAGSPPCARACASTARRC